jgi:hypothetical protein
MTNIGKSTSLAGADPIASQPAKPFRLPRRDYTLLPLIFVVTMLVILLAGEAAARLIYVQDDAAEPCEYKTQLGARYHPFCLSYTKVWEGPWITQKFNDCGYPTAESCTARPPRALRVVVLGSSTARGALVNYPDSFAARASTWLSERCGGLVDFQNLGTEPPDVDRIDLRIPEALRLNPSAIVLPISSYDVIHLKDPPPIVRGQEEPQHLNMHSAVSLLRDSRLFLLMQYHLYRDPAFQIKAFLLNGTSADYVRSPLSAAWQKSIDDLGDLLHRITVETTPAHVPVLLFYTPARAQAALAAEKFQPPGVDPFALGKALEEVAAQDGARFFDATPAFANAPDFQSLYYLTDGHLRDGGHAVLARVVEQALLSEPAFKACNQSEQEPGK